MVNRLRITHLLKKWVNDTITEAEKVELFTYLEEEKSNDDFFTAFDEIWKDIQIREVDNGHHQKIYQKILLDSGYHKSNIKVSKKERKSTLLIKMLAASVFIIMSAAIYLHFGKKESTHSQSGELTYV